MQRTKLETKDTRVVVTVTVKASIERAFRVYTEGFDSWWPRGHKLGAAALDKVVIEPRVGGRWFERTVDGAECDWGRVLAWEPPHRLVLSWHLDGNWEIDPDPSHASEVEITFVAEGPKLTRVTVDHHDLDRHLTGADSVRKGISSPEGLPGIVARYADIADEPT